MPRAADPPDDREPRHQRAHTLIEAVSKTLSDDRVVIYNPNPWAKKEKVTKEWVCSDRHRDLTQFR